MDRICKNCKWWGRSEKEDTYFRVCISPLFNNQVDYSDDDEIELQPCENFGCIHFEAKDTQTEQTNKL